MECFGPLLFDARKSSRSLPSLPTSIIPSKEPTSKWWKSDCFTSESLKTNPPPRVQDPKLWYGIGILYDRFGSLEHAEEAFSAVVKIDPKFEKSNEIYFRLGIIYKQQGKYDLSLQVSKKVILCRQHGVNVNSSVFSASNISYVPHQGH